MRIKTVTHVTDHVDTQMNTKCSGKNETLIRFSLDGLCSWWGLVVSLSPTHLSVSHSERNEECALCECP